MKYICRSCGICEHEFLRGIRMGAVILENSKWAWPKFLGEEGPELTRPRLGMWNFGKPCYAKLQEIARWAVDLTTP
jgi:hypothetical protein